MRTLRFIMGDQLNIDISSLSDIDKSADIIFMCEVNDEARSVKHHKKKLVFIFSAMRHFAKELERQGYNVLYTKFDSPANKGSFKDEVQQALSKHECNRLVLTEPSEYRVLKEVRSWDFGIDIDILPDERFLCTHERFKTWANGRKQLRMEYFYREMRKHYEILMDGGKPEGGDWNYDSENRKPPKKDLDIPATYHNQIDTITGDVIDLVEAYFSDHFGDISPFHFAVTREEALDALDQFIQKRLCKFGDYQDAMIEGEPWMYHSHLSFYINCGLLLPLECVNAAEKAYRLDRAPLNAVEGFIRQIIGWREYVRGIYWLKMPHYETHNFLGAKRPLPDFFWGAPTKMNCLSQCIKETKENAYAHHIQRLMVIGNFALLAGLDPDEVNNWYMIVYADAYQWVELPNVSGMILFADGGLLGSKPYAASGAYINKMSNYCKTCDYKVKEKNGPEACPFNYLYWDFLERNRNKLEKNPRLAMIYRTQAKMSNERKELIASDAKVFLESFENN